jgi:hypothetical protein
MKNGLFICWEFVSTYTFVFRESASFSFHFIEKIEKCLHPPRRPITGHRDELSVHIPTGWLHYSIQDIHICYLWSFANSNKKLQPIHVIWNKNFTYSTSMFWFCSITSTFFFLLFCTIGGIGKASSSVISRDAWLIIDELWRPSSLTYRADW